MDSQNIRRELKISGDVVDGIGSTELLKTRYAASLARAASIKPGLIDTTLARKLHSLPNGTLSLIESEFKDVDGNDNELKTTLTLEPKGGNVLGATRKQSARGVRFGQLLIESPNMTPIHEFVAVKHTKVERAIREAAAATLINDNNEDDYSMRTYTTLGFLKHEGGASLVTRFAPETLTFDNVLWRDKSEVTDEQIADTLGKSALTLATLHGLYRLTHGDAQPKNIAWNHMSDAPWPIDFEDSKRHIGPEAWNFEDEAEVDLATLMLFQPEKRSEDIFGLIADLYTERYRDASGDGKSIVSKDIIMRIRNRNLQKLPIIRPESK